METEKHLVRVKNTGMETVISNTHFIWKRSAYVKCCLEKVTSTIFVTPINDWSDNINAAYCCISREVDHHAAVGHGTGCHPRTSLLPHSLQSQLSMSSCPTIQQEKHRKLGDLHDRISEEFRRPHSYGSYNEQRTRSPDIFGVTDKEMLIKGRKGHLVPCMPLARPSVVGATTKPLKCCNKC